VTDPRDLDIVLVTGLSGAGRSTATRALEDLGWFVMDNLPSMLIPDAIEHVGEMSPIRRVAVVADVRSGGMFNNFVKALDEIRSRGSSLRLLFLEATDESLVRRFESSRRPHPLQEGGRILEGVTREREMLSDLRASADLVIDTTNLSVHDLRRSVENAFEDAETVALRATVVSFGFKNGIPVDADFVADVRFLPNPHWVDELRPMNGLDGPVNDYVVAFDAAREFLDGYAQMMHLVSDGYLREGKRYVTIALGCTGGKHRSVAMAENLAARLVKDGVETRVVHRDLGRE
jgi:RNase adapter protein RapZ